MQQRNERMLIETKPLGKEWDDVDKIVQKMRDNTEIPLNTPNRPAGKLDGRYKDGKGPIVGGALKETIETYEFKG